MIEAFRHGVRRYSAVTTAIGSEADLATVRSDLAALKSDVGSLIEQIKAGARNNSRRRGGRKALGQVNRSLRRGAAANGRPDCAEHRLRWRARDSPVKDPWRASSRLSPSSWRDRASLQIAATHFPNESA